jgi:DNA invertase Pin-like site-specific DNA recombinase
MEIPRAAAIYARISSDIEGSGLGVARQLADCHTLATSLGWTVAQEYVDNDLSAYSGKERPAYQQMLADIQEGLRDAVLVYHLDRLTRRPIDLEHFLAVIASAKVLHVRFFASGMDLASGDGYLVARMLAAVAAEESTAKSRRVRRKLDEVAASGKPHGGYHRPFGYEIDKETVRESEAAVVREVVARFIAGESLRSLCMGLDAQGVRTVAGGGWRTSTLRAMLTSGRIAGLRRHRGQIIGRASWPAIISPHDRDRVLARIAEMGASRQRTPHRYLLSGLLRCGRCGGTLFASRRATTRRYVCLSGPDHGGCGRITITAEPVEQLIADAVLYRLDTPELADALAGRAAADDRALALADALAADRAKLEELTDLWTSNQISGTEWMRARRVIEDRIHDSERQLSHTTRTEALVGLGHGDALRDQWTGLNLSRRVAIVRAVLDHAAVGPGTSGAQSLDPSRVQPVWRL